MHLSTLIKQKDYEKIVHVLRRDPITFVPRILLFLILSLIPILAYYFLNNYFPALLQSPVPFTLLVLFASIFYLSISLFLYTEFTLFYLDVSIVTNDRIVEMEQLGLFSRTISELELFRIQDVTSEVKGLFPSMFHYGNVLVKTASENSHIIFFNIRNPEKIREELIKLSHEDRKYHMNAIALEEH
jgi:membrane protein YdbS with pleckstrin-like domain